MMSQTLASVESALNKWLQPKLFAAKWDNVGLLVGSGFYSKSEKPISGILLCNDLTPAVLQEAKDKKTNLIISYHPPIFSALKSVAYGSWKEELIARCLAWDISVYSPHTTLDTIQGGINDRVLAALAPLTPTLQSSAITPIMSWKSFRMTRGPVSEIRDIFAALPPPGDQGSGASLGPYAVTFDVDNSSNGNEEVTLKLYNDASWDTLKDTIPADWIEWGVASAHSAQFGEGRKMIFPSAIPLDSVVDAVKGHLGLNYVQLAFGGKSYVNSVAVCVGSGASLLKGVDVDVYITGEMSHHDILDCVQANKSVIICGHCNSERHFLKDLVQMVRIVTKVDTVLVSKTDCSPLRLATESDE